MNTPVSLQQGLRSLRSLPHPPGLPWLGQTFQVDRPHFHQQLEAWLAQLGDAYRVSLAGNDLLVVADPAVVSAVLRDRPATFGRTDRMAGVAREMGFEGVFAANGERWKLQRPMVMAGFDPRRIKQYFPSLVQVTERLDRRWQRAAAAGQAIELQDDLMRYTVDVIAGLAFGTEMNTLEGEGERIQQHLDHVFPALQRRLLAALPLWRWFQRPADRELERHLRALRSAVAGFIADARARLAADPARRDEPRNLIEAMLVEREREGSGLSDLDLSSNVLTMLLAGEDTTAHTLAWTIHLLARHPEALARAQAEVRGVLGPARVPVSMAQAAELDFLEACTHETMRLKPVAPILPLQAQVDTVVAGVAVPAGTVVILMLRAAAQSTGHFSEPQHFQPERWLGEGGADASAAKRASMPFGAGPRICPGRYLALLEMKMVLATLLAGFEIEAVTAPGGGLAEERLSFTMAPVGLQMRLRSRPGSQPPADWPLHAAA
jgi:cytochrome P450